MSDHPILTLEQVRETAAEIVKDDPHKIVTLCRYANDKYEGPSCLVGHVLHRLGWSYDELSSFDPDIFGGDPSIDSLIYDGKISAGPGVGVYLRILQEIQDDAREWLEAYRTAERLVEEKDK